jgi:cellulose synthase/poly-beta-1,6-N-acetylglucosamine synthase-like glycosyltransferase
MKKAQVLYSVEYIIGGIGSMFRRTAVVDVGYYDTNTMTEDIDLSMKFIVKGNKENRLAYAADSIAYTESVHDIKSLITQRFRWKYGRMQTFLKNKKVFMNTESPYARQLTMLMLPFALIQEFLFLMEPIVVGYILYIIVGFQDWATFLSAFSVIMAYLLFNLWSSDNLTVKERVRLTYFAPPMYLAMYALSFVEYMALLKAMVKLPNLKNSMAAKHVTWSSPERQAKSVA